jgi:hypothetical protein
MRSRTEGANRGTADWGSNKSSHRDGMKRIKPPGCLQKTARLGTCGLLWRAPVIRLLGGLAKRALAAAGMLPLKKPFVGFLAGPRGRATQQL